MIRADLNGHFVEGNRGDEKVTERYGVKKRNQEGQTIEEFVKRMEV